MASNRYKVPKKKWDKWSEPARRVFNDLYRIMRNQHIFSHPKAGKVSREQWNTSRWNAAWMAADLVTERK